MKKLWIWILVALSVLVIGVAAFSLFAVTQVARKPAVYLYPLEDMHVQVVLDINGRIVADIPPYAGGWNVFANKEGLIEGTYDYLFYEAELKKVVLPIEGWVVPYNHLEEWFDITLAQLGLNEKEISHFKTYWMATLPNKPCYEIKLLSDEYLDNNMDLRITPEPDTEIRVHLHFTPLEEPRALAPPIITTPKRIGFTVVEWGGILNE